jgi:phage shock protein A
MRKAFSTTEKQQLIETVNSGKSISGAAKEFAKTMNRSEGTLMTKMYELKKKLGLAPVRNKKAKARKVVTTPTVVAVQKPADIVTMNFKPSRTEVHNDHVRLYF